MAVYEINPIQSSHQGAKIMATCGRLVPGQVGLYTSPTLGYHRKDLDKQNLAIKLRGPVLLSM